MSSLVKPSYFFVMMAREVGKTEDAGGEGNLMDLMMGDCLDLITLAISRGRAVFEAILWGYSMIVVLC